MPVPKHSKELKLKVIQAYLDGSKGYKILSQEFNVDLQTSGYGLKTIRHKVKMV
jgi:transposase